MDSAEAVEEIERIQSEFGMCQLQIPDPMGPWWYPVDRIEFDAATQSIRLVSDR